MTSRLTTTEDLPDTVSQPGYTRDKHGVGIVHLGLGAFHKAHQATYTDDALAADGGDWRITGVSLRRPDAAAQLSPQNCLFSVIERDVSGSRARVVGALKTALPLATRRHDVLSALCAPSTRIVSLTVTEKAYGIDLASGGADPNHPAIAADLSDPDNPSGVAGLLVWALRQRKAAGTAPFTVLSCDNLPENGKMVRRLLVDVAARTAPELQSFIEAEVAFPCSMVDRITPASTPATLTLAEHLLGRRDEAAVETEAFRQWVIEDTFPTGRPAWDAGGAIITQDVAPYEAMKLRMLNGAHSMLAYAGLLTGQRTVKGVMDDPVLVALIRRHLSAVTATLQPVAGVDFAQYSDDLLKRFANPNLAHETHQIATDGSQKMPQRIFAPAVQALRGEAPLEPFAFATAAWLRYTLGRTDDGQVYDIRDPAVVALGGNPSSAEQVLRWADDIPGLFPDALRESMRWRDAVTKRLQRALDAGMRTAVDEELNG